MNLFLWNFLEPVSKYQSGTTGMAVTVPGALIIKILIILFLVVGVTSLLSYSIYKIIKRKKSKLIKK